VLTTSEDGGHKRDGHDALCRCETHVGSRMIDSADVAGTLGDQTELMIWGDVLRGGGVVVLLSDGVLCEGVTGVDRKASTGPKLMPFD
jgi:hypothetical protein